MTTETRWYYEEATDDRWISAYYGYGLTRDAATDLMEKRRAAYPRARLRLVCETRQIRSYRERGAV